MVECLPSPGGSLGSSVSTDGGVSTDRGGRQHRRKGGARMMLERYKADWNRCHLSLRTIRKGRAKERALFWLVLHRTRWDHPEAVCSPPGVLNGAS